MEFNRELYIFPLIHTHQELGKKTDPHDFQDLLEDFIARSAEDSIRKYLPTLLLDPRKTRVYIDSLPHVSQEALDTIMEVNPFFHSDHFLADLLRGGYKIMGTENPKIMMELSIYKSLESVNPIGGRFAYRQQLGKVHTMRDRYIGRRINQSLKHKETGLLFIGADHFVERYLSTDIKWTVPHQIFEGIPHEVLTIWLGAENYGRYITS